MTNPDKPHFVPCTSSQRITYDEFRFTELDLIRFAKEHIARLYGIPLNDVRVAPGSDKSPVTFRVVIKGDSK